MRAVEHFLISLLISPVIGYYLYGSADPLIYLAATFLGVAAGVLIDLDHFILGRIKTGSWKHLKLALQNPVTVFTDQDSVLGKDFGGSIAPAERILSHAVIASATLILYPLNRKISILLFSIIGIHILSDLYRDWRNGRIMSFQTV